MANRSNHAKEKITIIDNEEKLFDDLISNLDQVLLQQIEDTNDTLEKVEEEYGKRIDEQNCKSDLFWRVVGISTWSLVVVREIQSSTLECTKLCHISSS